MDPIKKNSSNPYYDPYVEAHMWTFGTIHHVDHMWIFFQIQIFEQVCIINWTNHQKHIGNSLQHH